LIRVDGDVSENVLEEVKKHPAITEARVIHLGKN